MKQIEHKDDTHAKSIYLIAEGKALASKLVPIVEKIDEDFFGVMSSANQRSLVSKIEKEE